MASFKESHPKRHDLTLARTGGEGRSLNVHMMNNPCGDAHLKGPLRHVVKKLVSSGPSKEIVGLKKMKMMPGLQNSRVWEFLHEAPKVHRGPLGLCRYGPLECSGEFLTLP